MDNVINVAQAVLTGYDVSLQRQWRKEEWEWREEDMQWREHEREVLETEQKMMQEERAFIQIQAEQAHVDNARALWQRFVNRNRNEVMEKTEQLKALSSLSALLAGFALVSFLEFQFQVSDYWAGLLPLFALTTSITVGVEMAAVVVCSLMLANILRTAKSYISEEEEAEFMHRCRIFVSQYRPGDRPPAPQRTFAAHWTHRCEGEWRMAFRLFATGVPCFLCNVALAAWIKFHGAHTPAAATLVSAIMGLALAYNLYTHRKWGEYLLADEEEVDAGQGLEGRLSQPPAGLPFDWHLPPLAVHPPARQRQAPERNRQAADEASQRPQWWPPPPHRQQQRQQPDFRLDQTHADQDAVEAVEAGASGLSSRGGSQLPEQVSAAGSGAAPWPAVAAAGALVVGAEAHGRPALEARYTAGLDG